MLAGLTCILSTLAVFIIVVLYLLSQAAGRKPTQASEGGRAPSREILIAVVVLAVALRVPYLFLMTPSDEEYYIYVAKRIHDGCGAYTCLHFDHPPLYPHMTAIVFKALGVGLWQAKLLPFLLSLGSIPLLYYVAYRMFGARGALLSTTLYSLAGGVAFYTTTGSMYSGLNFFTLLALVFLVKGMDEPRHSLFLLAGACIGVASMFRLFGPLLLLPCAAVLARGGRGGLIKAGALAFGFIAATAFIALPFYSSEFVRLVFVDHAYYGNWSLIQKITSFIQNVIPKYLVLFLATGVALGAGLKGRTELTNILLLHAALAFAVIFSLQYHMRDVNQLMYVTYAAVPLSILAGGAANRLTGVWSDRHLALIALLVLLAPNIQYVVSSLEWDESVREAASWVRQYSDVGYIGDPGVAFISGRVISTKFFYITPLQVRTGLLESADLVGQEGGTLLVHSDRSMSAINLLLNGTDISPYYRPVHRNREFTVYERM